MEKTVFITGASTGIGRSTALFFARKGWKVVATMRSPDKADEELRSKTTLMRMDVTELVSIKEAVKSAIERFKKIDVVVNNAGYGLYGIFEGLDAGRIEKLFNTNVFGLMSVAREFLPHFREYRNGTIVNITSIGGRMGFPLYSLYQASKFAIEGFTESLSYELAPLGIKLRLVEPGIIKTDFYSRSMDEVAHSGIADYADVETRCARYQKNAARIGSAPLLVARTIYKAASSGSRRLRYHAGSDAGLLLFFRALIPFSWMQRLIRKIILG